MPDATWNADLVRAIAKQRLGWQPTDDDVQALADLLNALNEDMAPLADVSVGEREPDHRYDPRENLP